MINKFKELWIQKGTADMIAEEAAGADKYNAMGDKFHDMAEDEKSHKETLEEMDAKKSSSLPSGIQDTIAGLYQDGKSLSDIAKEVGKTLAEVKEVMDDYHAGKGVFKTIDTSYAGDIPNSKLARQDLEGETKKSMVKCPDCDGTGLDSDNQMEECQFCMGTGKVDSKYLKNYDKSGNRYKVSRDMIYGAEQWRVIDTKTGESVYSSSSKQDTDEVCKEMNTNTMKGIIEQTGKQLDQAADKSEDKQDLVSRMKTIQLKRQSAIISEREKSMNKTFKQGWSDLKKGSVPNNQKEIASKIGKEFGVQTTWDDGSVMVQENVSRKTEDDIRNKYGNIRIGDGVQEGSLWINGNE